MHSSLFWKCTTYKNVFCLTKKHCDVYNLLFNFIHTRPAYTLGLLGRTRELLFHWTGPVMSVLFPSTETKSLWTQSTFSSLVASDVYFSSECDISEVCNLSNCGGQFSSFTCHKCVGSTQMPPLVCFNFESFAKFKSLLGPVRSQDIISSL